MTWYRLLWGRPRFILALLLFMVSVILYGWLHYLDAKSAIYDELDSRLARAAKSSWFVIGDAFHDRVQSHPLTPEEDMANIKTLSKMANDLQVKYIYSMILDQRRVVRFTSSSATEEELRSGDKLTRFMDPYEGMPSLMQAFATQKTVVDTGTPDQWGVSRSIFIPYTTKAGLTYVLGADLEVSGIEETSRESAYKEFWYFFFVMLSGLPLLILYQRELATHNNELRQINSHLGDVVQEKTTELLSHISTDSLTKLPNRYRLHADLSERNFHALVLLNIDDFKEINDFFGVATADSLLQQVALWMKDLELDPYRVSGDEFAFLIAKPVSREEIQHRVQTILALLSDKVFVVDGNPITLTMTAGVSMAPDKALTRADIALHRGKETRKSIAFYDESENIEERFKINMAVSALVKSALANNRIRCHYQPILHCATGKVDKYEALVRVVDERGNITPPYDFLGIVQHTKLYPYITQEVVWQACNLFASREETVSINLSARDIRDPVTEEKILETLEKTGVGPRVIFEIIESEGVENFDRMSAFIKRVKALGAKIAIDDFGTGYSNFENVLKLEVDYIKIDGSLISEIDVNPRHRIVVETIVAFAHHTGAETVAEFVTSESILQTVKKLGITYAQGFHIGRPAQL